MKRLFPLLLAAAVLLTGCGRRAETPPSQTEPPPETDLPGEQEGISRENPLHLESLRIEISRREGVSPERLMEAAGTLPELLRAALADYHIQADTVQLTIGSSPAATVQALNSGGVDLAILPAEVLAGQETAAAVLLASGPGAETAPLWEEAAVGFQARLYAAPTAYGENLSLRVGKEESLPTWEELDHARWGVLEEDSLPGRRAVNLWLADNYEGNTLADLSHVAVYEYFDQLLQAAAGGEIDIFPLDARMAEQAFEVTEPLFPKAPLCLGETARFYDAVAAVSPLREDLSAPELNFKDPLMAVLTALCWYDGTQTLPDGTPAFKTAYDAETRALCVNILGPYRYQWADGEDLDAARRLLALEGYAAAE